MQGRELAFPNALEEQHIPFFEREFHVALCNGMYRITYRERYLYELRDIVQFTIPVKQVTVDRDDFSIRVGCATLRAPVPKGVDGIDIGLLVLGRRGDDPMNSRILWVIHKGYIGLSYGGNVAIQFDQGMIRMDNW